MLFDFKSFIDELRENPEKKEVISKFEKYYWTIEWDIKDQNWYQDYIKDFPTIEYKVPEELKEDFDWDLLMQLVAWSFSSDWLLDYNPQMPWEEENQTETDQKKEDPQKTQSQDNQSEETNSQEKLPEFIISVQSWDQVVVKKLSELWWFQILRLYEIYIEEQLNLQILIAEDEKEKEAIEAQRDSRLKRWKLVMENLEKDELERKEKVEKEEKLSDLMDQL